MTTRKSPALSPKDVFRRKSGLTLIEIVLVMSISSVLLAVGVSSLSIFSGQNSRISGRNIVLSHLARARAHAITSNKPTALLVTDYSATTWKGIPNSMLAQKVWGKKIGLAENTSSDPDNNPNWVLLSRWNTLPGNAIFLTNAQAGGLTGVQTIFDKGDTISLSNDPSAALFHSIQFNATGALTIAGAGAVRIVIGEGTGQTVGAAPLITAPNAFEIIRVSSLSGTARLETQ